MLKLGNVLKNISVKTGFTKTELKVIIFLIAVLIIGAGTKYFTKTVKVSNKNYDYSKEDSLFLLSEKELESGSNEVELKNENIDYKAEVLDFNKHNFAENKPKIEPAVKSIDLNAAGKNDLLTLPGIGEKTAENIIAYREAKGKFKSIEELLNVKGIGETKLKKIKKYLYIHEQKFLKPPEEK